MSLSELEHRFRRSHVQANFLVKIEISGYGDIYLSDSRTPFLGMSEAVNPLILAVEGIDLGDFGRISDIRLRLVNRKINKQSGDYRSSRILFSDLIEDGLDGAEITVKELVADITPIEVSTFSSSDLHTIFRGRIEYPVSYDEDQMTISATIEEQKSEIEIPEDYIGESGGVDPWSERKVIPIVLGDAQPESWGETIEPIFGTIQAILNPSPAKVHVYDRTQKQLVLSSHDINDVKITCKRGNLPTAIIVDRNVLEETDPVYGWNLARLCDTHQDDRWLGSFAVYFMKRFTDNGYGSYDYTYEDLAEEGSYIELAQGEDIGIMAPQLVPGDYGTSDMEGTKQESILLCVHMEIPEGAEVELRWAWKERWEDGGQYEFFLDTITPGKLKGSCYFTTDSQYLAFRHEIIDHNKMHSHEIDEWGLFGKRDGLRVSLKRTDGSDGVVRIRGIYAIPVAIIYEFPEGREDESPMDFGLIGTGIPTSTDYGLIYPHHPAPIIWKILKEFLDVPDADLDINPSTYFVDMVTSKLGVGVDERVKPVDLLKQLQQQSTLRIVRDPDGIYRVRCQARFGGEPWWQRAFLPVSGKVPYELKYRTDFWNLKVERPSRAWVKNVIAVDYMPDAAGTFTKTAWVRDQDSDDGYGFRSPGAEALSHASILKYEIERRLTISGSWIRDRDTAVRVRDYYLQRKAEIPNVLYFDMGHLGAALRIGEYARFNYATLDGIFGLLSGVSWYGLYFQVDDIQRQGDKYRINAIQCPTVETELIALVPRYMLRVP